MSRKIELTKPAAPRKRQLRRMLHVRLTIAEREMIGAWVRADTGAAKMPRGAMSQLVRDLITREAVRRNAPMSHARPVAQAA